MSNKDEISTASINHFTKYKFLRSIISNKCFEPRYCLENVKHINWHKVLGVKPEQVKDFPSLAYPMVCFTDLPKDKWYLHKQKYGDYVITLTEEWKLRNGLIPVIYLIQGNFLTEKLLSNCLSMALQYCRNSRQVSKQNFIDMLIPYLKLYSEGDKRYYDEREWRYFPWNSMNGLSMCIPEEEFNNTAIRKLRTKELLDNENSRLRFEYDDIVNIEVMNNKEKEAVSILLTETFNVGIESAQQKITIAKT